MKLEYYKNLTVLITGASSGIGKEMAQLLTDLGANLILIARRENLLKALKEELQKCTDKQIIIIKEDLTQPDGPLHCYTKIQELNLHVDILVNCAGIGLSNKFLGRTLVEYMNLLDLNIKALVVLTYLFLPDMVARGSGGILNVASVLGLFPMPNMAIYSASKSFVLSFSESLWEEYKNKGIHVTALCPGGMITGFFDDGRVIKENFRFLPLQNVQKVAKKGLQALSRNKRVEVCGMVFRSTILFSRIFPQRLLLAIMNLSYKGEKIG
jgi:hypothetical protein